MFIETLEFTIPIDLCSLFSTLQKGPRANLEFPASVNSYGTTQDASIMVQVRANKLTFKVDGVSSDSSMISKSECKTLKLAVFDVDRSLIPQEDDPEYSSPAVHHSSLSGPSKRSYDSSFSHSTPVPAKSSRTLYQEPTRPAQNIPSSQSSKSHHSNNSQSKPEIDNSVNVKQEPEDPDCIEIEPDPEPNDVKKESPFMQIDYSSEVPHTQTSQAALERLSFPQSSHSSQSFRQNVPHVPDYSEPGPSQRHGDHGDQNPDDYLVFQDDDNYGDDNEADYSNDGSSQQVFPEEGGYSEEGFAMNKPFFPNTLGTVGLQPGRKNYFCELCGRGFIDPSSVSRHKKAVHENISHTCDCGRTYKYRSGLTLHQRRCPARGGDGYNTGAFS